MFRPFPQELAGRYLESGPSETGQRPDGILDTFETEIEPFPFGIQLGGTAFLSGTMLNGVFWLLACVINPRARLEDMQTLVDLVQEGARTCEVL